MEKNDYCILIKLGKIFCGAEKFLYRTLKNIYFLDRFYLILYRLIMYGCVTTHNTLDMSDMLYISV